jgi:hypothetical protein
MRRHRELVRGFTSALDWAKHDSIENRLQQVAGFLQIRSQFTPHRARRQSTDAGLSN